MSSFFVKYINHKIRLAEVQKGALNVLRNMGEEWQQFDAEIFWPWFDKKTVDYPKPFSFVVLSDVDDFVLPDSIALAENNAWQADAEAKSVVLEQSSGLHLLTFPNFDFQALPDEHVVDTSSKDDESQGSVNSMAAYFREESRQLKQ